MPRVTRAVLLALSLIVGGCSFADAMLAHEAPPARTCFDASLHCDTDRGEICRRADGSGSPVGPLEGEEHVFDGICVLAGSQGNGEIYFELQPADAASPRMQFGPVSLSKGQNQELVVPAPVSVGGLVTYARTTDANAVPGARVRFRSVPLIPGRSLVFETQSSLESDSEGTYQRLLPHGQYVVTVVPRDGEEVKAPQERPFGDEPVEISAATNALNLQVSNPNELLTVSGQVFWRHEGEEQPAVGLNVWAMEAGDEDDRVRAASGTSLAQPAVTDEEGLFTLWLPSVPSVDEPHRIRLEVGPTADGDPFPTFRIENSLLEVAESLKLSKPLVLAKGDEDLELLTVHGKVLGPDGAPVPSARVSFRTEADEVFSFATTVVANSLGRYEATVFAGRYRASATAPASTDPFTTPLGLCSFQDSFNVTAAATPEIVLTCAERTWLFGQVIDSDANPVADVTVTAVRRADENAEGRMQEESFTDVVGHFRLALSPGLYDFTFAPPATVAPLKTIQGVRVEATQGENLLVFALDPPFELFGKLFAGSPDYPVGGSLDAWVIDDEGRATLVGRGLAQRDGAYSIVLPAAGN